MDYLVSLSKNRSLKATAYCGICKPSTIECDLAKSCRAFGPNFTFSKEKRIHMRKRDSRDSSILKTNSSTSTSNCWCSWNGYTRNVGYSLMLYTLSLPFALSSLVLAKCFLFRNSFYRLNASHTNSKLNGFLQLLAAIIDFKTWPSLMWILTLCTTLVWNQFLKQKS